MTTDEITDRARELIMELLADGEWHSHRSLVSDLIRTPLSEYAIRSGLRAMRTDPLIEADNRRLSYRHSPAWWFRIAVHPRSLR